MLVVICSLAKCPADQFDHSCTECDATEVEGGKTELKSECNGMCIKDNRLDECKGITLNRVVIGVLHLKL